LTRGEGKGEGKSEGEGNADEQGEGQEGGLLPSLISETDTDTDTDADIASRYHRTLGAVDSPGGCFAVFAAAPPQAAFQAGQGVLVMLLGVLAVVLV